ncbi:MAG: TolB family protein [Moorea sp. SIO2B7]|nr:TolB family protein [Moorena sp. SIO2B7]
MGLASLALLNACGSNIQQGVVTLNSRYHDEQPALSGDGRWLAFVSNRNGNSQISLYDLQQQRFLKLPGLNRKEAIAESPSLSRTGRYIAYISSEQGRPEIAIYDRATQRSEIISQRYRSWMRNPHISPSGRYIVFETARRGQWDIEVLDLGPNIELDISDGSPVNP